MATQSNECSDVSRLGNADEEFAREVILTLHKQVENTNPDIEEWYNCLENSIQQRQNEETLVSSNLKCRSFDKQLVILLRECLLSHRWSDATAVLSSLIQNPSSCRHAIHKAGTEIMYNSCPENYELLEQFINQLKWLRSIIGFDVVLEYAFYLLMIGKPEAASKYIKDIPKQTTRSKPKSGSHMDYAYKKYIGYVGILRYYEYKLIKGRIDQKHLDEQDSDEEYSIMVTKANEAIDCFKMFVDSEEHGLYLDHFMTAHVELLEFRERDEEALEVLKWYTRQNPKNPNTYRYLLQFHQRHNNPHKELRFMKKFCKAVPSDEMVLVFYGKLVNNGCPASKTLHLLFDLLDHGHWALETKPWSLLAIQLESIRKLGSADDAACLEKCWSLRRSWWPAFHLTLRGKQQPTLLIDKARVAVILIGHDCAFVTEVFHSGFERKELKYLKRSIRYSHKAK